MTGPTVNLLSSDGPASHLLSLPLAFEKDASEILVRNTISLQDPTTKWPNRSLERRRAFQHLLNRYIKTMAII